MDYGHKQAASNLIGLERRYNRIYSQAYSEMKEKADEYLKKFEKSDREHSQAVSDGDMSREDYLKWRQSAMQRNKNYNAMVAMLAQDMTRTNQMAMALLDRSATDTFMENFNFGGYEICKKMGADIPFTLVDKHTINKLMREGTVHLPRPKVDIPKDERWNREKINSALTQGILQGESIPKISKRLQSVTDMNKHAAVRNARTLTTGAENGGRLEKYYEAKAMGIPIMKKWESTLDHVTRESHVDVDGEVQELDHPFSNGLDYPGGMGPPEEVYNCRCTMVSEIKGHKYSDETRFKALKGQSYEEWKRQNGSGRNSRPSNNLVEPKRPRRDNFATEEAYMQARAEYKKTREIYNTQKERLIDRFIEKDHKLNSSDDLIAWAKRSNVMLEGDVETVVDKRLFDDITVTLDEMFSKYPEVKARQDEVRLWSLRFTGESDYVAEASGGLNLGRLFKDARSLYDEEITSQASGFTTRGDGTLATIIRHEYGHNADDYCRSKFSTLDSTYEWKTSGKLDRRHAAREEYERELIEITLKHGSEYSRTNTAEAFAEGFAEYTSNPNSEYGKAFGGFFKRWYYADSIE